MFGHSYRLGDWRAILIEYTSDWEGGGGDSYNYTR